MKKLLIISVLALVFSACVKGVSEDDYSSGLLEAGTLAPNFMIYPYGSSDSFDLNSLQGQYVVMELWASWCGDCKNAVDDMKSLYNTYASDSIVFLGYSVDTDQEAWSEFIEEKELTWIQTCDFVGWPESEVAQAYNLKWIPTFYLLDKQGFVKLATIDIAELEQELKGLN